MSSLAPTEFEKGVSDDDDDHNESEVGSIRPTFQQYH